MHELFPILAGGVVGLLAYRVASVQLRVVLMVVLSVIFGVIATVISGEALISWAFVLIDIPLVLGAAVVTLMALMWRERHATQPR